MLFGTNLYLQSLEQKLKIVSLRITNPLSYPFSRSAKLCSRGQGSRHGNLTQLFFDPLSCTLYDLRLCLKVYLVNLP